MTPLAPHLSWAEVLRGSGWPTLLDVPEALTHEMERTAAEVWTPLRQAWAGPLLVVSGLRSPTANRSVKGARRSQHMLGRALDLRPEDPARCGGLYDLALLMMRRGDIPRGGLCLYMEGSPSAPGPPRFLHADRRQGGRVVLFGRHTAVVRRCSFRQDRLDA